MLRRMCFLVLYACLLNVFIALLCLVFLPAAHSYAAGKPTLKLNRVQGPLGVTLTLSGKNFPPGSAGLSYIDSQQVPGFFVYPSNTSVTVLDNGAFLASNLVLPGSGPVGSWKIVVQDSLGTISTITYNVLAAPGQTIAGPPSLTLNPSSGMSGDTITFSGANWLPKKTAVNLLLQVGTASLPLLEPAPLSDANGNLSGTFHLPTNLTASTAMVVAADAATGALRAQSPIGITGTSLTPTPTSSPTAQLSPSPTNTTIGNTNSGGSNNTGNPFARPDAAVWGPVLLVVGAIIAIAALMLILFMIPWSQRDKHQSHSGHY